MSKKYANRAGCPVRRHEGNTNEFKRVARYIERKHRARTQQVLDRIRHGDIDAAEQLPRHRRHTAGWEAY